MSQRPFIISSRAMGFSGVDISATIWFPGVADNITNRQSENIPASVFQIGSIQTISYSIYSSKEASRSLGFKLPTGYARGNKTIAGTLIFNQLNRHVFDDVGLATVLEDRGGALSYSSGTVNYYRTDDLNFTPDPNITEVRLVDSPEGGKRHLFDFSWDTAAINRTQHPGDMPPFDIICTFVNELGNVGKLIIYGVDLIHESSTMSVDDIYTEVIYQYVARDVETFASENWEQTQEWRSRVLNLSHYQEELATGNNVASATRQVTNNIMNSVLGNSPGAMSQEIQNQEGAQRIAANSATIGGQ